MIYRLAIPKGARSAFPPYSFRRSSAGGSMLSCSSHRFWVIGYTALWAFTSLLQPKPGWAQDADAAAALHFAAAHQAQDAGNLDLAATEYLEVIRLHPEVAEVYASLGLVYNAQGKFAESALTLAK